MKELHGCTYYSYYCLIAQSYLGPELLKGTLQQSEVLCGSSKLGHYHVLLDHWCKWSELSPLWCWGTQVGVWGISLFLTKHAAFLSSDLHQQKSWQRAVGTHRHSEGLPRGKSSPPTWAEAHTVSTAASLSMAGDKTGLSVLEHTYMN